MADNGGASSQLTVLTATPISLDVDCQESLLCGDIATGLLGQLHKGYDVCSTLPIPDSLEDWRASHRTARKRADRCGRLGYTFAQVQRQLHSDAIFDINTSKPERQGRPMTIGYRRRQQQQPLPDYPCHRHCVSTYGVLSGQELVAYLWLYRAGDLALVSSILGHADHEANGVMYLLFQGAVESEAGNTGVFVYNRHDSGTDGLRFFKERLGFEPTPVAWLP